MAKQHNFQCSWTKFFTKAMNQLTILHAAKYPSHAKITKFLNAANHHFKHHVKGHNRGRSCKTQPRGVTNRPECRQPHHSTQSSKRKGNSNARKSCQTTTTSCRDRSATPFPCKHNRINEDTNNFSHLDTQLFDISMVTLEQNSQNGIDSADLPSVQDHLLQESSFQQFCSKKQSLQDSSIFHQIHHNSRILLQINHFRTIPHKKHCFNCFLQKTSHYRTIFCKKHHYSSFSLKNSHYRTIHHPNQCTSTVIHKSIHYSTIPCKSLHPAIILHKNSYYRTIFHQKLHYRTI